MIMQDKTTLDTSDTFREYIEALVEEVVINGEPFEAQKKWLRKHSEDEGVSYEQLNANLQGFFKIASALRDSNDDRLVVSLSKQAENCYISVEKVQDIVAKQQILRVKEEDQRKAKNEAERNKQKLVEKNRIPVKAILISLGVISLLDIIFLGWWCVIPLLFNVYFGMLVYDKCGKGEIGYEKLVFKGGALVVILFFASFLHWWSLLLILPAIYFIIGNDDNWDPK
jgi:hypothetical protein